MGAFDSITCELPLPDGAQLSDIQTKSFARHGDYRIDKNGRLWLDEGHHVNIRKSARPKRSFDGMAPHVRRSLKLSHEATDSTRWVPNPVKQTDFNGPVIFYGIGKRGGSHKYRATFQNGKVSNIVQQKLPKIPAGPIIDARSLACEYPLPGNVRLNNSREIHRYKIDKEGYLWFDEGDLETYYPKPSTSKGLPPEYARILNAFNKMTGIARWVPNLVRQDDFNGTVVFGDIGTRGGWHEFQAVFKKGRVTQITPQKAADYRPTRPVVQRKSPHSSEWPLLPWQDIRFMRAFIRYHNHDI